MNRMPEYIPSYKFDRTADEKQDMFQSWARDDQAFFASGACHILDELFSQLHQDRGFYCIHIKPAAGFVGNHWYATDGTWAFDHNGWTKETRIRDIITSLYAERYPGWTCEFVRVGRKLGEFEHYCQLNNHRAPWQYAYLPWKRAYSYIKPFPDSPPGTTE